MVAINLIILVIVFISSSFLSTVLMRKLGYPVPRSLKTREDKILVLMKLIMFSIMVAVLLAVLLVFGVDPLYLMSEPVG
ncbi:MAG: hypothetical protein LAT84_14085 [Balneolia bacterium]|nr:hypothetical protein [Balneolia bacterium]